MNSKITSLRVKKETILPEQVENIDEEIGVESSFTNSFVIENNSDYDENVDNEDTNESYNHDKMDIDDPIENIKEWEKICNTQQPTIGAKYNIEIYYYGKNS